VHAHAQQRGVARHALATAMHRGVDSTAKRRRRAAAAVRQRVGRQSRRDSTARGRETDAVAGSGTGCRERRQTRRGNVQSTLWPEVNTLDATAAGYARVATRQANEERAIAWQKRAHGTARAAEPTRQDAGRCSSAVAKQGHVWQRRRRPAGTRPGQQRCSRPRPALGASNAVRAW
jgi:hypothetical protein